jgi:hypothetical protein
LGVLAALFFLPMGKFKYYKGAIFIKVYWLLGYVTNRAGVRVQIAGMTLGNIVLTHRRKWPPSERHIKHEFTHVKQCWFFGPSVIVLKPLLMLQAWLAGGNPYTADMSELQSEHFEDK